jgi:hypothetical protein
MAARANAVAWKIADCARIDARRIMYEQSVPARRAGCINTHQLID